MRISLLSVVHLRIGIVCSEQTRKETKPIHSDRSKINGNFIRKFFENSAICFFFLLHFDLYSSKLTFFMLLRIRPKGNLNERNKKGENNRTQKQKQYQTTVAISPNFFSGNAWRRVIHIYFSICLHSTVILWMVFSFGELIWQKEGKVENKTNMVHRNMEYICKSKRNETYKNTNCNKKYCLFS